VLENDDLEIMLLEMSVSWIPKNEKIGIVQEKCIYNKGRMEWNKLNYNELFKEMNLKIIVYS
jgi:hypothetical protein